MSRYPATWVARVERLQPQRHVPCSLSFCVGHGRTRPSTSHPSHSSRPAPADTHRTAPHTRLPSLRNACTCTCYCTCPRPHPCTRCPICKAIPTQHATMATHDSDDTPAHKPSPSDASHRATTFQKNHRYQSHDMTPHPPIASAYSI
jgi:hypothetical protein